MFDEKFYSEHSLLEDNGHYFTVAEKIVEHYGESSVIDIGCGLGWIVKHLRNRKIDAHGIDISEFAVSKAGCEQVVLRSFQDEPRQFELGFVGGVLGYFSYAQLTQFALWSAHHCKRLLILNVPGGHSRPSNLYIGMLQRYGWKLERDKDSSLKRQTGWDCICLEFVGTEEADKYKEKPFLDPWLVRINDNTEVAICVLTTNDLQASAFIDRHSHLPAKIIRVDDPLEPQLIRERRGILASSADYVLLCDDSTDVDINWLLAALQQFHNPKIGAVTSPVMWVNDGLVESPQSGKDYWSRFPILWRTLAYQQTQGERFKFDLLKWKVGFINSQIAVRYQPNIGRVFSNDPTVTIVTAIDSSKENIIKHYRQALTDLQYPKELISLVILDDCHPSKRLPYICEENEFLVEDYRSLTVINTQKELEWLTMNDEHFFKWEGVRNPISQRVSCLYNIGIRYVHSEKFLLWESDTIPTSPTFLRELLDHLLPSDGGISGHYVCREQHKSLAWDVTSLVPFEYKWVDPGFGVQQVGGVPHGLLLMNSWTLEHFQFSVLANDPRDFRGPDLIMARDFFRLNIPLKIHWGVRALHYQPDGSYLEP